jgi:hypothetical protein
MRPNSYNVEARRIWLNLELAKKPPQCLEYIVVHEMVQFARTASQRSIQEAYGPVHAAMAHAPGDREPDAARA